MDNKEIYDSPRTVDLYKRSSALQKPEEMILALLKDRLSRMDMLDVGVGGGRTTAHFAPLVRSYTGIDYAANMIKASQERFAATGFQAPVTFKVCDVRNLTGFDDHSFDFVFVSFNGLDYMPYADRTRAFTEIRRVGKAGGYLCFSTHNAWSLCQYLHFQRSRNLGWMMKAFCRYVRLKSLIARTNGLEQLTHLTMADGGEDFQVQTTYVKPEHQSAELQALGFKDIRLFSEKTGLEIFDFSKISLMQEDRWIYYLCGFQY